MVAWLNRREIREETSQLKITSLTASKILPYNLYMQWKQKKGRENQSSVFISLLS